MLRKLALTLLVLPWLALMPAYAQTVDEVISKSMQARGGVEKFKAIKSMKVSGKIVAQGQETPITLQVKSPNSVRMDITFQGKNLTRASDGTTGWTVSPFQGSGEAEKLSQEDVDELKDDADLAGPLVGYKEKGHTVELVGKEDLEGSPAYKIKLTRKNGKISYIFIDADNFLELKTVTRVKRQGNEIEIESHYGNYKEVNGMLLPFNVENKFQGRTVAQYVVDKIEIDPQIDDNIFKIPVKEPAK